MIIEKGGRHGAVLRFLPPLIVSDAQIDQACGKKKRGTREFLGLTARELTVVRNLRGGCQGGSRMGPKPQIANTLCSSKTFVFVFFRASTDNNLNKYTGRSRVMANPTKKKRGT